MFVHLLPVKTGHQSEQAGLETPQPEILPGHPPELTHSISCYGAVWTPSTFGLERYPELRCRSKAQKALDKGANAPLYW